MASVNVYAQMPQYKLAQFGLKGKVKTLTERTGEGTSVYGEYRFANDQQEMKLLAFNTTGNVISEKKFWSYSFDGTVVKYSYTGRSVTLTHYNSSGAEEYSQVYPENKSTVQYTYYDNGAIKTESVYDEYGTGILLQKYTYNTRGQMTERRKYYGDNMVKYFYTMTYDGNGNLLSTSLTGAGGYAGEKYTYRYSNYDSFGNWTMCVVFKQETPNSEKSVEQITTRVIEYY